MHYGFDEEKSTEEKKDNKKVLNAVLIILLILIIGALEMNKKPDSSKQGAKVLGSQGTSENDIPEKVYNDTTKDDHLANVLFANKKVIYYAYMGSCPYRQAFVKNLEALMSTNPLLKDKYYYYPDPQGDSTMVVCKKQGTRHCVENFLFEKCSSGVCIVNGAKKKLVAIKSQDASTVYAAIDKFKDW